MSHLVWSDALSLDMPVMDDTHREFVDLLAAVEAASDATLLGHWAALIDHSVDHFGREDDWMQNTGFAASNCHGMQHDMVLQVMRECLKRGEGGDLAVVRGLAGELGTWFTQHAQSMDAALAQHLQVIGFDPETGAVLRPLAMPKEAISGCGGASCSPAEAVEAVDNALIAEVA